MSPKHVVRSSNPVNEKALSGLGIDPLLARLLASRGVSAHEAANNSLAGLLKPDGLLGIDAAAQVLADALEAGARMVVIGDYDCDGATATAVAVRGLRMLLKSLGADDAAAAWHVDFLVPNRFEYGYGLSPEIVQLAAETFEPDLLITVDNGIASVAGVQAANDLGVGVVVTDHHLPGEQLPDALAIVNPNQPGCTFSSKAIAGVGVMFYVLLALRAELRNRGHFDAASQPRLDALLDLVALGTVADVVRLDGNNRLLVQHGLQRIRSGKAQPGIYALFQQAGRDARKACASDMGFALGPRLNAAGRLADMTLGIRCLTTDDAQEANKLAAELTAMNEQRKRIENDMRKDALEDIEAYLNNEPAAGVVVANESWHHGVVGILASRIKERLYRPTIAMAPADDGTWRGSGRSIPGVHLRDVLDLVSKRLPQGAMPKFGGHAMAAGLTLQAQALDAFKLEFSKAVEAFADESILTKTVETDGSLPISDIRASLADTLQEQVWGQGFPAPLFYDEFEVVKQALLKQAHSKLWLKREGQTFVALWWNNTTTLPSKVAMAYRFERDTFSGGDAVQLIVEQVF